MPLKITEMYAFIAHEPDGEGIPCFQFGDTLFPLVGADTARVDSLRQMAQVIADTSGMTLTLARFTVREELETITPREGDDA